MHSSVLEFFEQYTSEAEVKNKTILEVGSLIIGTSVKPIFTQYHPALYMGLDMILGPGVNVHSKIEDAKFLDPFDIVISAGSLEHAPNWQAFVNGMKRNCASEGLLMLTTVSPGFPRHNYPDDFWRFTVEDIEKIFSDFEILVLRSDPLEDHPGVFLKARKPKEFQEKDISSMEVERIL